MKIYDTSSKSESLYHYTTGLLGLPITDTTTLTREDFVRSANVWLRNVNEWIWKTQNTWQYDDTNEAELPIAETDLVDDQRNYRLPTAVFDIRRVKILDSSGNDVFLDPVDLSSHELTDTKGLPAYYSLVGDVIKLDPPPDTDRVTLTDGLILDVARDIKAINATATRTEPGIPRQFHDLVAFGIAKDKSLSWGMPDLFKQMDRVIQEKRAEIEGHYAKRFRQVKSRIVPQTRSGL